MLGLSVKGTVRPFKEHVPLGTKYISPVKTKPDIPNNQCLCAEYEVPAIPEGYVFEAKLLPGCLLPPSVLSRGDISSVAHNDARTASRLNKQTGQRMLSNSLGAPSFHGRQYHAPEDDRKRGRNDRQRPGPVHNSRQHQYYHPYSRVQTGRNNQAMPGRPQPVVKHSHINDEPSPTLPPAFIDYTQSPPSSNRGRGQAQRGRNDNPRRSNWTGTNDTNYTQYNRGQYNQGQGHGQYNQGQGQYNQGKGGQYNQGQSQYNRGQYNQGQGQGQYNQGQGQYNQGQGSQYNQDQGSQYNQGQGGNTGFVQYNTPLSGQFNLPATGGFNTEFGNSWNQGGGQNYQYGGFDNTKQKRNIYNPQGGPPQKKQKREQPQTQSGFASNDEIANYLRQQNRGRSSRDPRKQ
eukprot:TRINITY_DN2442_c0_g1_i1.p1 TRINITY_DN2442_c0_g1~~TRINITY_DN2442_c0_g1_i1.p1  ORF type:complete len:402 (-),score=81.62 TRINITY_DN2442_c0_g1_i1:22-1227(-)